MMAAWNGAHRDLWLVGVVVAVLTMGVLVWMTLAMPQTSARGTGVTFTYGATVVATAQCPPGPQCVISGK